MHPRLKSCQSSYFDVLIPGVTGMPIATGIFLNKTTIVKLCTMASHIFYDIVYRIKTNKQD